MGMLCSRHPSDRSTIMGGMTNAGTVDTPESTTERWSSSLALLMMLGLLIAIIGESISAAGAPQIGVVDEWGRIDEAVSQIASWQYLLVGIAALALLGGFRAGRADLGDSRTRRLAWLALGAELAALAAAAAVGIAALFERTADADVLGGVGVSDYYSGTERIGETLAYVAIMIVAVGLVASVVHHLQARDSTSDA